MVRIAATIILATALYLAYNSGFNRGSDNQYCADRERYLEQVACWKKLE